MKKKKNKNFLEGFKNKLSITPVIIISCVLYILSQAAIIYILSGLKAKDVFILQTSFSKTMVMDILNMWKQKEILDLYKMHFYIDFIHPILYSIFLASLTARLFRANSVPDRFNIFLFLPFLAGLLDTIENVIHVIFITDMKNITSDLVYTGALCANAKWIIVHICILFILFLAIKFFVTPGNSE